MKLTDYDVVLHRPSNQSSTPVGHIPDSDDPSKPRCGTELRSSEKYIPRDPAVLPDSYSLCGYCDPDHERNVRHTGTKLCHKLERMDPDEVKIK